MYSNINAVIQAHRTCYCVHIALHFVQSFYTKLTGSENNYHSLEKLCVAIRPSYHGKIGAKEGKKCEKGGENEVRVFERSERRELEQKGKRRGRRLDCASENSIN